MVFGFCIEFLYIKCRYCFVSRRFQSKYLRTKNLLLFFKNMLMFRNIAEDFFQRKSIKPSFNLPIRSC